MINADKEIGMRPETVVGEIQMHVLHCSVIANLCQKPNFPLAPEYSQEVIN